MWDPQCGIRTSSLCYHCALATLSPGNSRLSWLRTRLIGKAILQFPRRAPLNHGHLNKRNGMLERLPNEMWASSERIAGGGGGGMDPVLVGKVATTIWAAAPRDRPGARVGGLPAVRRLAGAIDCGDLRHSLTWVPLSCYIVRLIPL